MAGIPVVAKLHNYVDLTRYRYVNTLIATTADECRYALAQGWVSEPSDDYPKLFVAAGAESASGPDRATAPAVELWTVCAQEGV